MDSSKKALLNDLLFYAALAQAIHLLKLKQHACKLRCPQL